MGPLFKYQSRRGMIKITRCSRPLKAPSKGMTFAAFFEQS
jgi:hypothetical protein